MDEKKINSNGAGNRPTPPPMTEKKSAEKTEVGKPVAANNKKLLAILIPVIALLIVGAVVIAVVLKSDKKPTDNTTALGEVVATDENGVAITDENGVPVTYTPETQVVTVTGVNGEAVTDEDGKALTTVVYKDVEVTINTVVTDAKGEPVTNSKGEQVTQQEVIVQDPNNAGGNVILGTTAVAITDGQGNTAVDQNGNLFTTIVEITSNPVTVEPADLDWKTSMGGTALDYFSSVKTDANGDFIAANVTNSRDGDFKDFEELEYIAPYTVLVKYDNSGNVKWEKAIGSTKGILVIEEVVPTDDGGFYAVGYGERVGGERGKGYYDCVVYKFDEKGNEQWHKIFGTSTVDMFRGATLTSDGGIVAVGSVGNNDKDAKGFGKEELQSAACIVKYDANGNLVWKNILGGNQDYFTGVVEGTDGSYFCVGNFYTDEFFKNKGKSDGGIVKINADGKYQGAFAISGTQIESFNGITACKNGGVVVVGKSNSADISDSDSFFTADRASRGGYDAYIIKVDNNLKLAFAQTFRGQFDDELVDVVEKENGTFVATGKSNSSSRDLKGVTTRGGDDIVIACFDKFGSLSWTRSFGGTRNDSAQAICLAKKGGYVVAGRTDSKDIDMKGISQYVVGKPVGVIVKFPE